MMAGQCTMKKILDQAFAKGGGGIRDVLYRREGGLANYGFGNPNFTTIAQTTRSTTFTLS